MANKSTDDDSHARKDSIKGFALKVFKETSVTAVSAILSTSSIPRKIFRALIFISFTAGFLYQCIKFLTYVLEYPTVVSIDIERPDIYMVPAFTFCNSNKIKRSKYCNRYPENCTVPDELFCKKYPRYCGEKGIPVPKMEIFEEESYPDDINLELGHDIEDLLENFSNMNVTGPIPLTLFFDDYYVSACYSMNSRIDSPLDPKMKHKSDKWFPNYEFYTFNPEEDETFIPDSQPGIVFAIDSPFNPVNPFEKGIFMQPGFLYKISIRMKEEKLLPYPYRTNCMNYTDLWLKNNRRGPRSQKACRELCYMKFVKSCFNCIFPMNGYPSDVRTCTKEDLSTTEKNCDIDFITGNNFMNKCRNECKEDCLSITFLYDVQKIYMTPKWKNKSISREPRMIQLAIDFDDSEIVTMNYRAQFQEVETFSYIGGFIGIWLGVSLVQVADVLESLFRIVYYLVKERLLSRFRRHTNKNDDVI